MLNHAYNFTNGEEKKKENKNFWSSTLAFNRQIDKNDTLRERRCKQEKYEDVHVVGSQCRTQFVN